MNLNTQSVWIVIAAALATNQIAIAASPDQPNIVVIMVDDLGYDRMVVRPNATIHALFKGFDVISNP